MEINLYIMNIQVLFNFITDNNRTSLFLCTADYDYLNENILHDTELYVGMEFTHEGEKYKIENLSPSFGQRDLITWSIDDADLYYGNPAKANFDLYINCKKV